MSASDAPGPLAPLLPVLEEARRLGLVGPGPLLPHLDHALGFATAALTAGTGSSADDGGPPDVRFRTSARAVGTGSERAGGEAAPIGRGHGGGPEAVTAEDGHGGGSGPGPSWSCLDLGSGAGLPGLPLALAWPGSRWTLLDAGERRVAFLVDAVRALALEDRVAVVGGRAEDLAHDAARRGRLDLVVARGFGPPAVTAECAAGFLGVGGLLVVSEPPGGRPHRWPAEGLAPLGLAPEVMVTAAGASYQVLRQRLPCPVRFPRRTGVPAKRPLFGG